MGSNSHSKAYVLLLTGMVVLGCLVQSLLLCRGAASGGPGYMLSYTLQQDTEELQLTNRFLCRTCSPRIQVLRSWERPQPRGAGERERRRRASA